MAVGYNPRIVTDGLVLALDAGNTKSYPGSGSTWYDLSGNSNNGTIIGINVSHSTDYGGVFVLPGTSGNYIDVPINLKNTTYTVMGAARYVTVGGRTFSSNQSNSNWLMGHWSSSTVKHYAEGWVTDSVVNEDSDTNWRVYAATGNYSADSWAFYVNGQLDTANGQGSNGPNGIQIGRHGDGEYSNSQISFLLVYNRVLAASEIEQNYNALRGRFGI
jgi:hypothetical protein